MSIPSLLPIPKLAVAALLAAAATIARGETGSTASLVVPIVLSSGGAGGSFYTTELTLTNRGSSVATLELTYAAAFGGGNGSCTETLLAGEQKVIPDSIAYLVGRGLPLPAEGNRGGTLRVAFTGLSAPDAAAATARTTTATRAPQPVGAAGLAYAAVPAASGGAASATLYGLRASTQDRSNVAVYNPTPDAVTVRVTVVAGDGSGSSSVKVEALEVPGLGWVQYSNVFDGTDITNGWVTVEKTGGTGSFGTYGVVNCNGTNDGSWVTPTVPGATGSLVTVPVLVETTSGFVSELVLSNRSASETTLTLRYSESLAPALGTGGTVTLKLGPREQLIVPDALEYLRGKGVVIGPKGAAHYAGALRVSVQGAALADVFAGARTASLCPSGGQFGLFTPGVYEGQEATTEAWLYGLRADEKNRTNVAVLNAGEEGTGPVTLELQAFDGDAGGVPRGDPDLVTLEPGGWDQKSGFLGNKGVRNGWVRVKRLSGSAPWVTYAVVNDGVRSGERTGDGAYVPMVPGLAATTLKWERSVVPGSDQLESALAYDPQGQPAIAYSQRLTPSPGPTYDAMMVRWDSGTSAWVPEKVTSDGQEVDLEFDPVDGNPAVAVLTYNLAASPDRSIRFSDWTGSGWETRTVEDAPGEGVSLYAPKLAFGPDGMPALCYSHGLGGDGFLKFAERNGGTWSVQHIDRAGTRDPIDMFSLAYDPAGNPVVAYRKFVGGTEYDFEIWLARRNGSTWESQVVERGWGWGRSLSFALDSAGNPAIAHWPGGKMKVLDPSLIRWDGSKWNSDVIVSTTYASSTGSLAFDPAGVPNIAVCRDSRSLELVRREPDGTWSVDVVEPGLAWCADTDLRMDPEGRPSVAYRRKGAADSSYSVGFAHLVPK